MEQQQTTSADEISARVNPNVSILVRFLQRGKPLRTLPIWARYLIATAIVLLCFAVRYALGPLYPYPFLLFVLGIIFASFILDRGSGFLATILSAVLAWYFFIEPSGSFQAQSGGQIIAVFLFLVVGFLAASIIEALRVAVEELAVATEDLAASRRQVAENLSLLETVIEGSPDPIFVKDREGRFVRVNSVAAKLLGAPPSAVIGRRTRDFLPAPEAEKLESIDRVVLDTRAHLTVEEEITVAGKGPRCHLISKAPWWGPDGTLYGVIKIARDIHERKEAEDAVRAANAQKEVLLHDINHRIKNHLQSIISALNISRRKVTDEQAGAAIQQTIARLGVLARVYDRLELKPGGEAVVSARDFLEGLCADLQPALIDLRPISIELRADHVPLELGRAVSVGLIANEALSNSLKHAYPDDAAGTITISFEQDGERYRLTVSDDGIGTPIDRVGQGVGTRLIRALAQQLGGTAEWQRPTTGTTIIVRFPVQANAS